MMRNRVAAVIVRIFLVLIIVGVVLGYAYSKSQDYVNGPQVVILTPKDGATVKDRLVPIYGTTQNITELTLNGRKIYINENNEFEESLLLFPGYNRISVRAKDRFDKSTEEYVTIVYDDMNSDINIIN